MTNTIDNNPRPERESMWSLSLFLLLSAASTWAVWLWPFENPERRITFVFVLEFRVSFDWLIFSFGNCLPGILAVIWVLSEGSCQTRRLFSTLARWRTNPQWYVVAFAIPWAIFLPALLAALLIFPKAEYFLPTALKLLERFLIMLPVAGFWEELAWRAFALRKLESRFSWLVSSLILGLYWGVWHIPLWLAEFHVIPLFFFVPLIANVVTLSVIFSYLYHRSGFSLPVVILLHTTYDVVATEASLTMPGFGTVISLFSMIPAMAIAIAIVWTYTSKREARMAQNRPTVT